MALLQQIRVKLGWVLSLIIALALLSFLIDPNTLESAVNSMSSKYDVGKINGKSISYSDFMEDVDRYTTINELMNNSNVQNEQQREQIQNAAWQELVDRYLFLEQAQAAGLTVGKDELLALTTGDMVSPLIAQNPAFCDNNGVFSSEALVEFVNGLDADQTGKLRVYWNYLQNTILTQQYYNKYGALFTASDYENALQVERAIAENNITANVDFISVPVGYVADSSVVVSNSEIKKYYDSHKDLFKQKASRDIEYVVFEVRPSADDVAKVVSEMSEVYPEFGTTENVKTFLTRNSDRQYSEYWYKEDELKTLSAELSTFVNGAKVGEVSPIITQGDSYYAARVIAESKLPDAVQVRYVATMETAVNDSLLTLLRLAEPVRMTQTYIIPGCEALLSAKLNTPALYKTTQGINVIAEVVEKSELLNKKQVAILEKTVIPSKETINEYYSQANTFASLANGKYEGYRKAVDSLGVYSHTQNRVLEGTSSYGSVDGAKELTRWVFEAKKGKVSDVVTINNAYFLVAVLKDIHKEGTATLAEVSSQISQRLLTEKRAEAKAAQVASQVAGLQTLEEMAEALGTSVSHQDNITFAAIGNPSLDPKFIGSVAKAELGVINGPVAGSIATYIFRVNSRDEGSYYTEDDARNYATQMSQYKQQLVMSVMSQDKVTDNRARFF